MVEEEKIKAAVAIASKEGAKMISNASTDDVSEEEVRGEGQKNQHKGGTKDDVTHSDVNDHLR